MIDEAWNPYSDEPWHPYKCPTHDRNTRFTDYAMLTGPGTVGGDGLSVVKPKDIADGTANTIFIVEAWDHEIIWTEPKDVGVTGESFGVNLPRNSSGHSAGIISSKHSGGGHVVLGDGSVKFISDKIDKTVLKSLTTINGNESVSNY